MVYLPGARATPPPPPPLPRPLSREFIKQGEIGWLQSLMGLMSQNWAQSWSFHLQSLGDNITGERWISSIIRKIWDISWGVWNYKNKKPHAIYGPPKIEILKTTNEIITYHFIRGITGLPQIC